MAAEESLMRRDFTRSLGLCVLFLAPSAGAQVLKCTDAEKNVTYSDVPCLRTEKTAVVDTRASSNVMDHSSIRAQKGRLFAPVAAAPVYSAPPAPPPPSPAPFTVDRTVKPARQLLALTKSVAEPNPVLRFAPRRRCCFYGRLSSAFPACTLVGHAETRQRADHCLMSP